LNDESKISKQLTLNEKYIMFIIKGKNSMRRRMSILYFRATLDANVKLQILKNTYDQEWLFICDKKYEVEVKRALKDTIKNSGTDLEINFVTILNNKYKTIDELDKAIKDYNIKNYMQHLKLSIFDK
jgi:hypothetical protein